MPNPPSPFSLGWVSSMAVSRKVAEVPEWPTSTPTEAFSLSSQASASRLAPSASWMPYPPSSFPSGRVSSMHVSRRVTEVPESYATTPTVLFPRTEQASAFRVAPSETWMPYPPCPLSPGWVSSMLISRRVTELPESITMTPNTVFPATSQASATRLAPPQTSMPYP